MGPRLCHHVLPASGSLAQAVGEIHIVGRVSGWEGTYLWSCANSARPQASREGVDKVRAFGLENDLALLMDKEWPAGTSDVSVVQDLTFFL